MVLVEAGRTCRQFFITSTGDYHLTGLFGIGELHDGSVHSLLMALANF